MSDAILDHLPRDEIIAALSRSPGNEIDSGKLASPESSAALAVNTFGLFLNAPERLPELPGTEDCGWPALRVELEHCARFPWSGGLHPWLDAFAETGTHIIGIESKRYEPFRGGKTGKFSDAYWRPMWGEAMGPFETMRDRLADGSTSFEHLDAAQLVKHAFGLRTEAHRLGKAPVLVYLHAEPETWPDGRPVPTADREVHAREARTFADAVAGAEVSFGVCTYRGLLEALRTSGDAEISAHADKIEQAFQPLG